MYTKVVHKPSGIRRFGFKVSLRSPLVLRYEGIAKNVLLYFKGSAFVFYTHVGCFDDLFLP